MPVCDDQGEIVKQSRFLQQLAKKFETWIFTNGTFDGIEIVIAYKSFVYIRYITENDIYTYTMTFDSMTCGNPICCAKLRSSTVLTFTSVQVCTSIQCWHLQVGEQLVKTFTRRQASPFLTHVTLNTLSKILVFHKSDFWTTFQKRDLWEKSLFPKTIVVQFSGCLNKAIYLCRSSLTT